MRKWLDRDPLNDSLSILPVNILDTLREACKIGEEGEPESIEPRRSKRIAARKKVVDYQLLVDDEGSSSESSLEDFDDHVPPTADDGMHDEPSSAITISYENMTKEELILQCKMKNIHADKRNFLKTQITKVLKADKEEEMQSLIQEDE